MSRTITLEKATRIEGNAAVHIEIDEGRVVAARFAVQDFRGFGRFMQGRRVESAPHLVSRICGLCSASHQAASLAAIEDAFGIEAPASVRALREIVVLGEWIASHSVSYFFLTMPDFMDAGGGLFEQLHSNPDMARDALALRRAGQEIVRLAAGRAVHPVSMTVGGFAAPVEKGTLADLREVARDAADRAARLASLVEPAYLQRGEVSLPGGNSVNHLAYDASAGRETFVAFDARGEPVAEFDRGGFDRQVAEMRADWSFAKFPYLAAMGFPAGIVLVGPVARSMLPGGPLEAPEVAGLELAQWVLGRHPRGVGASDACRLIEIVWAAQRIGRLLDEVDPSDLVVDAEVRGSGEGIGVIEAPRGVLMHRYEIESGCISRMRLLVATQFNNAYINMMLKDLAELHLEDGAVSEEGERAIGRAIRVLDPCLSCATH